MANIILVHPVHGAKVAISEQEAKQDEVSGWTRYTPSQPVVLVTPTEIEGSDDKSTPRKMKKGSRNKLIEPTESASSTGDSTISIPDFLTPVSAEG